METPDRPRVWTPSWKCVIITVLLGVNVILICSIRILCYHFTDKEKYRNELYEKLCLNNTDISSGCVLCPPHWLLHGDSCYYYSDVTYKTWSQSWDHCKMMGADLLVIKNELQQEFIQKSLRQQADDMYWIGLHHHGDSWKWLDREHYNHSLFQIQTQSSGQCVLLTRSGYYHRDCESTNRWICLMSAVRI